MKLIIPIGIPACGKTTWRRKYITKYPNTVVISPDEIRQDLYDYETGGYKVEYEKNVWTMAYGLLYSSLEQGKDCLFDATNIWIKDRKPIITIGEMYNADIIAVFFIINPKLAALRNRKRKRRIPERIIYQKYYSIDPPKHNEGYTDIKLIKRFISIEECLELSGKIEGNKCIICDEIEINE